MCLARDNAAVQRLVPDRSDQPFGKAILPGRGRCNRFVPNAHGSQPACDDGAIDPIAITDHVTRSTVPRKCLGDLACDPLRRRIGCDVDPDKISAINPYYYEAIQQFEANGGDHERIHGGNVRSVVSQKGLPPLTVRSTTLDHVLGDTRLRDLKPELEQFAVNAWRTPKGIFDAHPPDQYAQLYVDLWSPSLWSRLPTPVAAKAGSVPTHERLGPDDGENLQD